MISARKDLQEITAPNAEIQIRISFAGAGTSDLGQPVLLGDETGRKWKGKQRTPGRDKQLSRK